MRRILVLSTVFPSRADTTFGVFVKERIKALANLPGYEIRVVSPVPYFPRWPWFRRWHVWSQFPHYEVVDGLSVFRPRYVLPPKIGGYVHSHLLYPAVMRAVRRILRSFDFDLIDAHFVYPNGVVAAMLGKALGKPAVITGRGEDILRFPRLPLIGRRIRSALCSGTEFIALSREIAGAMVNAGAPPERVTLVPNGVNTKRFRPVPQLEARARLNLSPHSRIIISVGDIQELKGFHLLVDAIDRLRERFPDVHLVVVGGAPRSGDDFSNEIRRRIGANGLQRLVTLAGRRPHDELKLWYSAADVFVLLSSREGSPNVLMEALACGLPAVGTPIGGIRDVLQDADLGILLQDRSVEAAARGLTEALSRQWDRARIRAIMQQRDWTRTAQQVVVVWERALRQWQDRRNLT